MLPSKLTESELRYIHRFSSHHRAEINNSSQVACFYCLSRYSPDQIKVWIDRNGNTAICPHCGIDSVLPNSNILYTDNDLQQMQNYWFSSVRFSTNNLQ